MPTQPIITYKTNQSLSLKLIPTEQCNFRCVTCYEDPSIGRMSKKVINKIKKFIDVHLPNIKHLSVDWHGGEPLIAKDIIYDISDHILTGIKGRTIHYVSRMMTDGFQLNLNTFKKLLTKEVRNYQISLARPTGKAKHKINGYGSFGQIWHNILSMKEVDDEFKIMIRIPVTSENSPSLKEFCELIKKGFSNDQRFSICLESINSDEEYLTYDTIIDDINN